MKLKLLLAFLLIAEVRLTLAQTSAEKDKELNEKYWIYRDRFKKRFVNIGGVDDGQSLPFIRIFEGYNTSVLDSAKLLLHIPDNQKEKGFSGSISKGEMPIELGYYISVLATEYRLLKWDGADLTAIRSELFYAINAINRLDRNAEHYYNPLIAKDSSTNLNGFLIRDDIPHGFYRRWRNLGDHIWLQGCENSGIFSVGKSDYQPFDANGNPLAIKQCFYDEDGNVILEKAEIDHVVGEDFEHDYNEPKKYGNKWNEFSQDQLIGILLGLRFVEKYVDDDFVKPTTNDIGFNLVTESKNIVERLLDHISAIKDCGSQIQHANDGNCTKYIEDAEAGIEAALRAGMKTIGVGNETILNRALFTVNNLSEMTLEKLPFTV